jgi:HSP20 family molecular chaperone IbpA
MTRLSLFNSPLLLGFDQLERAFDRVSKGGAEGYPPYNIEQIGDNGLRITLAVAGFSREELTVAIEDRQLIVQGKQVEDGAGRVFLHRGIAARQFQRSFLLAEGIEVTGAELGHGLLHIDLARPVPERQRQTIAIRTGEEPGGAGARTIDVEPRRAVRS